VAERVTSFCDAVNILAFNLGLLMHSEHVPQGPTKELLVKTQRNGKTVQIAKSLAELRGLADLIPEYSEYGRSLVNHVGLHEDPIASARFPLADRPPEPQQWSYTGDPLPIE
jgi:hypothetical protein